MKRFLLVLLSIVTFFILHISFFIASAKARDMAGYVMVYHKDADHGLHMAYSWDGYTWTAFNNDKPIMAGDTIAVQKGIRDPYIFRNPKDGAFLAAMTDLHVFGQRDGVRTTEWERTGSYGRTTLLCFFPALHHRAARRW